MSYIAALKARYREFKRYSKKKGLWSALTTGAKFVLDSPKRALLARPTSYQSTQRVDLEERWRLISNELQESHQNVLDIGCNEGALTRRASRTGRFALGIDVTEIIIEEAQRKVKPGETCYFLHYEVTPENVSKLPSFDVTFLLTVYYHWGEVFGWEEAEEMLKTVAGQTGTLFYQTPADSSHIESENIEPYTELPSVEMHREYLNDILENKEVSHLGTTDYRGEDREDALFIIE